ncbi:MAG: hypothetical protein COV59_00400 [Candidatus Magasanikbacteria bacterium CG11_big_fil_rev_8_21_14_0_20_39_34]|uniref:Leucine-binding protein domain-containing protein n=1 Tax=Candidatus Magasanikbacteria bacterium CG11_big_fil_rev_8_21_14_0_20_39_34 TaxID=1974653 RepID=A0A2H0N6P9_9BACT|nr:MAG: hypothetical protein COV59_00400 [Candidatus Magasanikbacteria bacterium CG11_big_fil_rev_8_21_14_0_20_39_34]
MKKVLFLLMSIFILSGCSQSTSLSEQKDPIVVGGVFALTGVGAAIGEQEYKGAQLAVDEVNAAGGIDGRRVTFMVEDVSIDKMSMGTQAIQKLLQVDKVVGIVGPTWDEPAQQMLPIIENAQVPILMPDQTNDLEREQNFSFAFSTWYDNRVGIRELLRYAQKENIKRVAIIRPVGGGFWEFTRNVFLQYAPEFGVEVIEDIDLGNPLETDFRTPLTKIKAKQPDAIFIVVSDYNECTFMKQAKELGINIPILSTESAGNEISRQGCANILENMYFSTPKHTSRYQEFEKRFQEHFHASPLFPSVTTSYDAMKILLDGIHETGSTDGNVLRIWLENVKDYKGVSFENIQFDKQGFVSTDEDVFEMKTLRNGIFVSPFDFK